MSDRTTLENLSQINKQTDSGDPAKDDQFLKKVWSWWGGGIYSFPNAKAESAFYLKS